MLQIFDFRYILRRNGIVFPCEQTYVRILPIIDIFTKALRGFDIDFYIIFSVNNIVEYIGCIFRFPIRINAVIFRSPQRAPIFNTVMRRSKHIAHIFINRLLHPYRGVSIRRIFFERRPIIFKQSVYFIFILFIFFRDFPFEFPYALFDTFFPFRLFVRKRLFRSFPNFFALFVGLLRFVFPRKAVFQKCAFGIFPLCKPFIENFFKPRKKRILIGRLRIGRRYSFFERGKQFVHIPFGFTVRFFRQIFRNRSRSFFRFFRFKRMFVFHKTGDKAPSFNHRKHFRFAPYRFRKIFGIVSVKIFIDNFSAFFIPIIIELCRFGKRVSR